mgnify:CR=1 FL=1
MAELIAYIHGPMKERTGGFIFFGGQTSVYYQMNPQVYLDDSETPTRNLGVFDLEFGQQPSKEDLEARITQEARQIIGHGMQVGKQILAADRINIQIEHGN